MKKNILILIIFLLWGTGGFFSQMPDISNVWLNHHKPYAGTIENKNDSEILKINIDISEQNQKNDQEYFISGTSEVQNTISNFEGSIKITKYKNGKKQNSVFGEYEIAEEPKGMHSGMFTGKFVYTFTWNPKTEKIEKQSIEFIGTWKNYEGNLVYKTNWKNGE
ncbi:MAG: hypothetical protein LBE36_05085 [Flavobacteriaceae bacterium]|jgi:hypothetical protein|nr:hypothetical protein [Flavobacteriaceae bacterium]